MFDIKGYDEAKIKSNMKKREQLYKEKNGILVTAEWDPEYMKNQLEQFESAEVEHRCMIAKYNKGCEAVNQGFDNVPVITYCGDIAYMLSLAYGCELKKINNLVNAEAMFSTIEEAAKLQKLETPWEHGIYPIVFERMAEFEKRWGHHPITITDNQSPIDVLTTIFNSEQAMLNMYDEPEIVHHMLSIITDSIIEINRYIEKKATNFGGFKSSHYQAYGMHVSDDNAAFFSPSIYEEFATPYINRLSAEFGGIAFHCCMGHAQNLKNFALSDGFMGFDAMVDYNPMDKILDAITGKGVWNVYNYPWAVRDDRKETFEETFKRVIDETDGRCGLLLNVYNPEKQEALKLADKIREYAAKK